MFGATFFLFARDQCESVLGLRLERWTVSLVPAWLRADSGTNLIKQGEIVTG